MRKHPETKNDCPLAAVDQRLADAHRLWHQAEAAYFEPNDFRIAIQNTIQTLRTVTFILQKHKAIIPKFAEWYGEDKVPGEWQRRLSSDPLMRWMVDARNRIEKQGDLESKSVVRAEIIASYLDEGPRIDVPARINDTIRMLLESIPKDALGGHVRRNGILRIERRWVENTLPDFELLEATAIAYGKIAELVYDAHRQIGLDPPPIIHDESGTVYDLPAMGWRLPCMVHHGASRTVLISLADGSEISFETKEKSLEFNSKKISKLVKRYGRKAFDALAREYKTETELAAGYFALVRAVFLRDGYHKTMIFFFRDCKMVRPPIQLTFENVQQKYVVMRQLAAEVVRSGADSAMLVGEVWKASAKELKPYERPADLPNRREALTLQAINNKAESIVFEAEIVRNGTKVSLAETLVEQQNAAFQFAPFLEAWGCPVPKSWLEMSRMMTEAAKRD